VSSPFLYNFNQDGLLQEAANRNRSSSPYWWLSSGGYFRAEDGRGWTNRGALPAGDPWRQRYASSNPVDTDNGYHPQNIFRMSTRSVWRNLRQEVYFVVTGDSYSASPNRNASNGLLFFNRYQDADSLYYTGVRVDGSAVIKKKVNGTYYTMAYVSGIYPGTYDRELNPSLLPKYTWIGLRSEVVDLPGGSVQVKLYLDRGWQGSWELVATAIDDGTQYGPVIRDSGYAGIRTDFMDVLFENYRLRTIP
jgi:hypothetical protein